MFEFLAHGKLKLSDEAEAWPWSAAKQERWMAGRRQLTDEMVEQFREGCALLQAMSSREYDRGESKRYRAFQLIDKKLTWSLTALEARLRTTAGDSFRGRMRRPRIPVVARKRPGVMGAGPGKEEVSLTGTRRRLQPLAPAGRLKRGPVTHMSLSTETAQAAWRHPRRPDNKVGGAARVPRQRRAAATADR